MRLKDKFLYYDGELVTHHCEWCGYSVFKLCEVYTDESMDEYLFNVVICTKCNSSEIMK